MTAPFLGIETIKNQSTLKTKANCNNQGFTLMESIWKNATCGSTPIRPAMVKEASAFVFPSQSTAPFLGMKTIKNQSTLKRKE